jgi:hypothetical protein
MAVPSKELFPGIDAEQPLKPDLTPIIIWLFNNSGLLGRTARLVRRDGNSEASRRSSPQSLRKAPQSDN